MKRLPVMKQRIAETSPRLHASLTLLFYLLTIIAGAIVLLVHGRLGLGVLAACYLAVTILFYHLLRPVSKSLPLLAAFHNLLRQIAEQSGTVPKQIRRTTRRANG